MSAEKHATCKEMVKELEDLRARVEGIIDRADRYGIPEAEPMAVAGLAIVTAQEAIEEAGRMPDTVL